jgi:flavin-dependent dehydrogenase
MRGLQLSDDSRVVIVGGGPSGSFTALHLLERAAALRRRIHVTILEGRDFNKAGPVGCNKCAGILSSGLTRGLERLGLRLPADVIQSELDTYVLHDGSFQLPIHQADAARRIISVYRGAGPRLGKGPAPRSFDDWLLREAQQRGAEVHKARAQSIQAPSGAAARPVVMTPFGPLEADLVVLASGVNSRVQIDDAFGYQAPQTEVMAQDEVQLPEGNRGGQVHIYFDHPRGLLFGALIPKGRYTNVSLLGRGMPADAMRQFIAHHHILGSGDCEHLLLCGCAPRVAVQAAQNFFADRFVTVGDAAVTRLYKDGIGSAFLTAEAAARTALEIGVGREDFQAGYRPLCDTIARDNRYGRFLFDLWTGSRRFELVRRSWLRAVELESRRPAARRPHTKILWGMFTGDYSYESMFWQALSLPSLASVTAGLLASGGKR